MKKKPKRKQQRIPAAFTQLMGYGLGFIAAWWKRCVLPETIFAEIKKHRPLFEMEYQVDPLKLKVSSAKVFVQGQNLLSFDNIDAMDAENLNTGYPVMKSINVGLSVQF